MTSRSCQFHRRSRTRWRAALPFVLACALSPQPTAGAPVITEFPVPTANSVPGSIVFFNEDGKLWFVERGAQKIGRMSPNGGAVDEFGLVDRDPFAITAGPDSALWFTGTSNVAVFVGRMTPSGSVTNSWGVYGGPFPGDITTGAALRGDDGPDQPSAHCRSGAGRLEVEAGINASAAATTPPATARRWPRAAARPPTNPAAAAAARADAAASAQRPPPRGSTPGGADAIPAAP